MTGSRFNDSLHGVALEKLLKEPANFMAGMLGAAGRYPMLHARPRHRLEPKISSSHSVGTGAGGVPLYGHADGWHKAMEDLTHSDSFAANFEVLVTKDGIAIT